MMLTREKITDILLEKSPYLASEYGVKRIGLFGSYAKGTPTESSDIDIVVDFEHPIGLRFIEFTEYLEHLFGKRVDVLTETGIQGIRIPHVAQEIRESIVYVPSKQSGFSA
ncbi:MAG: nucleotidyltransferase family protein [Candidatus Tectomicrobia bacterium]|nr:nucleotidyltransferase family protein [Candidatus Tectomicrobia bacterium]